MFKSPAQAFKLLVQIKNNPTHFLPNNRPDVAMIAKLLQDKKIIKMGVKKDDGEVIHLTKRTIRNKDLKNTNPPAVQPPTHLDTPIKGQGDGAKAHLLESKTIIPQKSEDLDKMASKKQGEKMDFK